MYRRFSIVQVEFAEQQVREPRVTKSYVVPNDPLFRRQWYLVSRLCLQIHHVVITPQINMTVEQAWLQGFTGCNVTVAVVDDGS